MNFSESTKSALFLLIDLAILVGSLGVVLLPKVIYSALLLGLVFVNVALLYLLLNADFLAAAQVLVYVGAVNVLIVFAIMLISAPESNIQKSQTTGEVIAAFTLSGLFALLTATIFNTSWDFTNTSTVQNPIKGLIDNVHTIGFHLLTDLLLPFELLSLLLLVALVGAITIARKQKASN